MLLIIIYGVSGLALVIVATWRLCHPTGKSLRWKLTTLPLLVLGGVLFNNAFVRLGNLIGGIPLRVSGAYSVPDYPRHTNEADVILKAVATTARFGEPQDRIDGVVAGDEDIHYLAIFRVEGVLKGAYTANEFNVAVHSPALAFGINLHPDGSVSVPDHTFTLYLRKAVDQHQGDIYVIIGSEVP